MQPIKCLLISCDKAIFFSILYCNILNAAKEDIKFKLKYSTKLYWHLLLNYELNLKSLLAMLTLDLLVVYVRLLSFVTTEKY